MADDPNPRFAHMHRDLRAMSDADRLQTIVEMFKVAAGEWAAMVLENCTVPPGVPPPEVPGDGHPIREALRGLDVSRRCEFLGEMFTEVCREFAELIAEGTGPTH